MLGLTTGELILVALLVFAVVSAKFWPAVGAGIAVRLGGSGAGDARPGSKDPPSKSERTQSSNST